jgi:hypothetical protein
LSAFPELTTTFDKVLSASQIGVLIKPDKDRTIHRIEGHSRRLVASLDVKLMTKDQDLKLPTRPATGQ